LISGNRDGESMPDQKGKVLLIGKLHGTKRIRKEFEIIFGKIVQKKVRKKVQKWV
jgi:hypothetical protein